MNDDPDQAVVVIITAASLVAGALVCLQTDFFARKFLSADRVEAKRRNEYTYEWKTATEKVLLQLDYKLAGGFEAYKDDPDMIWKNIEFMQEDKDLDLLLSRILSEKATERFSVLKIGKDPHDPTDEWYLFLLNEDEERSRKTVYELPLMRFGLKVAKAFEDIVTTTTMVFVADASSGKGISMMESLVQEAKTNVAVLSEPFWLVQFALLLEASIFADFKMKKLIFALCRLDGWSMRRESQQSRTLMITLPGMATTPSLLPLIQSTFPEDRHVFTYDNVFACIQRAEYWRRKFRRGKIQPSLESIVYGMCQDPVRYTVPLPSHSPLPKDASLKGLQDALSKVPLAQSRVVETWMRAIDSFFKLKQDEKYNGYLPFVLKLDFLTSPVGNFHPGSDSYWILRALLQFITGCRSRPLPEGVLDSAKEWLKDYNDAQELVQTNIDKAVPLSGTIKKSVENCVFQHKSILIGNKTLQDTVQPREHWTLKKATRAGCSCCGPDGYDDEMDTNEESPLLDREKSTMAIDMTVPGAFASALRGSEPKKPPLPSNKAPLNSNTGANWQDGKLGFAFDPTRFAS